MDQIETGGCLCGKVRFTTHGPLREVIFCSQCRRQSGLYFAATSVGADCLDLEGEAHVTWFASSSFASRVFCGSCGTLLFWKPKDEPRYAVLAGAFDRPEVLTPATTSAQAVGRTFSGSATVWRNIPVTAPMS